MATRSMIAQALPDGTFRSIYCHWDGYPAHNGIILHRFYNDAQLVEELLDKGDLSSLSSSIETNKLIQSDLIGFPGQRFDTADEAVEYYTESWCEWFYKFEDGIWWARDRNTEWRSLAGVLEDVREEVNEP